MCAVQHRARLYHRAVMVNGRLVGLFPIGDGVQDTVANQTIAGCNGE